MNKMARDLLASEYPLCKCISITFSISSRTKHFLPDKFTHALGVEPSWSFAKGDPQTSQATGEVFPRATSIWALSSEGKILENNPERHAAYLLEFLENKVDIIAKYRESPDLRVSIRFWWKLRDYHGGFTVSSETLQRICGLCNELDFTFLTSPEEDKGDDL